MGDTGETGETGGSTDSRETGGGETGGGETGGETGGSTDTHDTGGETGGSTDTHDTGGETGGGDESGVDTSSGCGTDLDGDGHLDPACGGDDCDDDRSDVHPGASEVCDGVDNDCDGSDATINAIEFDAVTDALTFSSSSSLEFGGEWTVEAWVYLTGSTGGIFSKGSGLTGSSEQKRFAVASAVPVATLSTDDEDVLIVTGTASAPTGEWVHIAWVGRDDRLRTYINGDSAGSEEGKVDLLDSSGSGALGAMQGLGVTAFTGYLSDVRISEKAQYTSSFSPSATLGSDSDTVVYWPLDEGTGSSVRSDPGSVTATLSGATWAKAPCRP